MKDQIKYSGKQHNTTEQQVRHETREMEMEDASKISEQAIHVNGSEAEGS